MKLYFVSGEFLVYRHQFKEAAAMYEKAAELSPDDYQLAVAAAIAMRQAGRPHAAEKWYRQAVALKPSVSIRITITKKLIGIVLIYIFNINFK